MKTSEIIITRFSGVRSTKPKMVTTLKRVLDEIQDGTYQTQIEACHEDLSKKDKLPVFTPTGKFSYRSMAGLEKYNGIICLDIDHVENPIDLKESTKNIPWVTASFITPSSKGLKVIIQTDATPEDYKQVELEVSSKFEEITGFARDNRCKDIARIQFVSHDPELYINEKAEIFSKQLIAA